jgi:hypothetical protein
MCTVTFIPRRRGYRLAMNRDEKLTRAKGLPPKLKKINGRVVLSPSEPGGGTWMALHDGGASLALINWYAIKGRARAIAMSRGEVILAAGGADTADSVTAALERLPLGRINPFRLIGVFPAAKEIVEWRWDMRKLGRNNHPWRAQQWISSGFDEPMAQRARGKTFAAALRQKSAGSAGWLRRLHRSHAPEPGPFSTCMHRADAATVSYTEVSVNGREGSMEYIGAAPCGCNQPEGIHAAVAGVAVVQAV